MPPMVFRPLKRTENGPFSAIRSILLRRGSTEEWELQNPVLWDREAAVDTTKWSLKIGDGHTRWTDLPEATPEDALALLLSAVPKGT